MLHNKSYNQSPFHLPILDKKNKQHMPFFEQHRQKASFYTVK